MKSYIFGV